MKDIKTEYPNQYYASYDAKASQPTPITGWYDVWGMSNTSNVPPANQMVALTPDEWAARLSSGHGVQDGKIVEYTAPVAPVPLKIQAQRSYTAAISTVYAEYGALNEPTPDDVVAYLKGLKAIANGSDTTSTELPTAPEAL